MKIALLSREYPPEVYGGAGVHVEYLARELAALAELELAVHCFGAERRAPEVAGSYQPWAALEGDAPELAALRTLSVDLLMAKAVRGTELVHTHTWYANFAGHLAKLMYGVPHVMTSHSLEPLRPWKAEQLAGWLRAFQLLREDVDRSGRRRDRRVPRACARTSWPRTRTSIRRACTSSTMASIRLNFSRIRGRTCSRARASIRSVRTSCSSVA